MWKLALLWLTVQTLGRAPAVGYRVAYVVGGLAYRLRGSVRAAVEENLAIVTDESDEQALKPLAQQTFRNAAYYYVDLARMPYLDVAGFEVRNLRPQGVEHLWAARERGAFVLASAHFANPEICIQALGNHGIEFMALTEPVKPPALSRYVDQLRSSQGNPFLALRAGSLRQAIRWLRNGKVVGVMIDRQIEGHGDGVKVPLFGRLAEIPRGAPELARHTGCPILPVFVYRRGFESFDVVFEPSFEVANSTDRERDILQACLTLAGLLEKHVAADPAQWIVLRRFWRPERLAESGARI
jgi:KDO2-lipid IV(A) lauroyltransferase